MQKIEKSSIMIRNISFTSLYKITFIVTAIPIFIFFMLEALKMTSIMDININYNGNMLDGETYQYFVIVCGILPLVLSTCCSIISSAILWLISRTIPLSLHTRID